MFFKFLFWVAIFFLLVRYIGRMFLPSSQKNKSFNPFQPPKRTGRKNFDQIEDAEYEDLSDKNQAK